MRPPLLTLAILCLAAAGYGQYLEAVVPVGDTPGEILWDSAVNKVYCVNEQDASITVISGETNEVLTTIQVGDYPSFLCLNTDGSKLYCSRGEENKLVVVDTRADTVLKTLTIPNFPGHMVYSQSMDKLYISCNDDPVYRIVVLDATADTVLRYINARDVGRLLWHPVTNMVFSCGADTIRVIDCLTDEIAVRTQGGGAFWCYNPANGLVYMAGSHSVSVLASHGDSTLAVVPGYAGSLSAAPLPNKVYAAGGGVIRVIDGGSNQILDSLLVGGGWMRLVTDLDKGRVYCSNTNAHKVDIVDVLADTVIETIPLGNAPRAICWNRANSRVYISDESDNVVYVIRDTTTGIAEEAAGAEMGQRQTATVVRGVLFLSEAPSRKPQAPSSLLNIGGRKVMDLHAGANDVSRIPPGVYFVVSPHPNPPPSGGRMKERGEPSAVTKVIVQR